jgi:DNA polymerase-4
MRFLSLLTSHLPARVEALLDPRLAAQPLVVVREWDNRVLDASPEALAAGVGPGDSRRRVEQVCPQAVLVPAREPLYQAYHDRLKAVAAAFAPAVEASALGEFFIEISALARSFPSEKSLALTLLAQAEQAAPLQPAAGLAANKFTALQAARLAERESSRVLAVPPGGERAFLAPLPLAALPDPPAEMVRRLHLFGLTTLGGLAQLPHPAFVLQFGPALAPLHDLARGLDPRPLEAQAPPPSITRQMALTDPLLDRGQVLTALERLAGRVARTLAASGHHTLALSLWVVTADGQSHTLGAPLKPPTADDALLRRLVGRLLGKLSLSAGVVELGVTAYPLREWHLGARQLVMLQPPEQVRAASLRQALRHLRQRFGEWVVRLASAVGPPLPVPIQVRAGPDQRPASMAWGGWERPVTGLYEHWRERRGWWDQEVARDYYQVETNGDLVFTLFRDEQGRWFLDRRRP